LKYLACVILILLLSCCKTDREPTHRGGFEKPLYLALHDPPGVTVYPYRIYGDTAQELRDYIDQHGPRDSAGRRGDAFTRWYIRWHWPFDQEDNPIFEQSEVEYQITVSLPTWDPTEAASAELIEEWNQYYRALIAHEKKHVSFARDNAPRIREEILKAKSKNPLLTEDQANRIAESIISEIHQLDREYDHRTQFGYLEGVQLPREMP